MRRFVVIGQRATASPDFSLMDLAGTSGRLDVLLRCVRAAMLVSNGLRRDVMVYLVLLGGPRAPRTLRFDSASVRFLRPEERSLATLAQKVLATQSACPAFTDVRPGVALADGGLDNVLADVRGSSMYVLEEGAQDLRGADLALDDAVFFLGDHLGFDARARADLATAGATALGLGPVSVHAEDAIAVLSNELDRRVIPGSDRAHRLGSVS